MIILLIDCCISLKDLQYNMPFPSGPQSSCREFSWWPHVGSLLIHSVFLLLSLETSLYLYLLPFWLLYVFVWVCWGSSSLGPSVCPITEYLFSSLDLESYQPKFLQIHFWSSSRKWQLTPVFLLENPMDRGAWQATVHGVAKSQTQLKRFIMHLSLFLLWCPYYA